MPEAICCCGRHGNDVIHMHTKFHPHALLEARQITDSIYSVNSEYYKEWTDGLPTSPLTANCEYTTVYIWNHSGTADILRVSGDVYPSVNYKYFSVFFL